MKIETSIIINAPADQVFLALIDFNNYKNWNQFILKIFGRAAYGEKIKVIAKIPNGPKMFFKARISHFQTDKELRWKGNFFLDRFFLGEHYFQLKKISETQTELIHGEHFSGWFLGLFKIVLSGSQAGYHLMNQNLKSFVEQKKL